MRDWKTLQLLDASEADLAGVAPGKRTLTMGLPPVQRRAAEGAATTADDPHAVAAQGTAGRGAPLPFLDAIQRAFGHHDVGDVRAHDDDRAATAAHALGADAFAFGDAIAFAGAPSLHTAAHEAAHVVQQRAGVSVPGGLGRAGDEYERHADAVADRVVAGQSAADLLDQVGGARADRHVQRHGAPSERALQRTRAGGVSVTNMQFAPKDLKDDGATTTTASVSYSAAKMSGPATLTWTIEGAAFGSTISPSGVITPGLDTVPIDKEKVQLTVKAVDSVQAGAHTTGKVNLLNQKVIKAKADLTAFLGGGPYAKDPFTSGLNGKFAATYAPQGRTLTAEVRLAFAFKDDQPGAKKWTAGGKKAWVKKFVNQVQTVWSGQWQFENIREPKIVWKKLNPVSVRARAKEDNATPHFTVNVHKAAVGNAVGNAPGTADFNQASITPQNNPFPNTGPAELAALTAKIPTPVQFAAPDAVIGAADQPKLDFVGTYLHSVRSPKFLLTLTGHAQKDAAAATPKQIADAAKAAKALSKQRANAVRDRIRAKNPGVHKLTVVAKGDTGAASTAAWDKVETAAVVDPAYVNTYPVLSHEFGHMLGIGDEYSSATAPVGSATTHDPLARAALGNDMADSFTKVTADAEGLMQGGSDVRPTHYVTLWEALAAVTAAAASPVPPFGQADWKFVGF